MCAGEAVVLAETHLLQLWHLFQCLVHQWLQAISCFLRLIWESTQPWLELVKPVAEQLQLASNLLELEYMYAAACASRIQHYVVQKLAAAGYLLMMAAV